MVDVSVVIPTHNRAQLVKGAIDSVLAQSMPVREILVVNDNSSDDTEEVLRGYGDSIRVFRAAVGGAAAARNVALPAAAGEWIAFLDDDDVWLPNKTELQMKLIRDNPKLGLVYSSDYAVDDALTILYPRIVAPENRGDDFELILRRNFIFQSCAMARRDAVQRAGYMDPGLRFAPDWDLWLKIAAHYPFDFVAEPLALCRHSASGCLTKDISVSDRLQEMRVIFERAIQYQSLPAGVQRAARGNLERQCASGLLMQGSNAQALRHSLRAVSSEPSSPEGYRLLIRSLVPKPLVEWTKRMAGGNN